MSDLATARYLSLATFRKNGNAVATPVWFAEDDGKLYAFTAGDSGKVKRLRNGPRARVAPCTVRGKLLGDWQDADARIVADAATVERAYRALRDKYGLQMWLTDLSSRLTGRYSRRAVLEIALRHSDT
ncbi:MAG TPA: PPOX class F420-dependent oxidoreductase [Thermoanaerobaculia bacterium]|nr:PPOX class F420-dependent oxidoreductase [Thermoanaerobaculia bacterium]